MGGTVLYSIKWCQEAAWGQRICLFTTICILNLETRLDENNGAPWIGTLK